MAQPLSGITPGGAPFARDLTEPPWTLLLFLSTTCDGCAALWRAFSEPSHELLADTSTVLVTRAPPTEAAEKVAALGGAGELVMSESAWTDYGVHSGPFFVLVDGARSMVATEGVAWSVEQIVGAVEAALAGPRDA
ncbi:MAG: hypothetical protein ACRDVW_10310 [Acidimicrobiales bacterium]